MSVSRVLGDTAEPYQRLFARTVVTGALVFGILHLLSATAGRSGSGSARVWLFLLASVLTLVGTQLVQGALAESVRDAHEGRVPASPGELCVRTRPGLPTLVGASILTAVAIGFGLVLLIVPGLLLWTPIPFTAHALSVLYYRLVEPERPVIATDARWKSIWRE